MNEIQFLEKIREQKSWRVSDLPIVPIGVWLRLCKERAIAFSALAQKPDGSLYRLGHPCDCFNPFDNPAIAGTVETVINAPELFDVFITDNGRLMLAETISKPAAGKRGRRPKSNPRVDKVIRRVIRNGEYERYGKGKRLWSRYRDELPKGISDGALSKRLARELTKGGQ